MFKTTLDQAKRTAKSNMEVMTKLVFIRCVIISLVFTLFIMPFMCILMYSTFTAVDLNPYMHLIGTTVYSMHGVVNPAILYLLDKRVGGAWVDRLVYRLDSRNSTKKSNENAAPVAVATAVINTFSVPSMDKTQAL